jgi:hypothetical protein
MWGIDFIDPKILLAAVSAAFKFINRLIRKRVFKKRALTILKEKSKENLETIKNSITKDGYDPYSISRTDELNQISSIFQSKGSLKILIHGEMGCGKSGILKHLAEINLIKNTRIIFINCRNYTAITDPEDLVNKLDLKGKSLSELLSKVDWPRFTFLDSLDEIARWPAAFHVIHQFLEAAAKAPTILICTCRTKDFEENKLINNFAWDKTYAVPNLNETQIKTILDHFKITLEIPRLIYSFIQNLFFLDKFVRIFEEGLDLSAITTKKAILDDYWKNSLQNTRLPHASKSKKKEIINAVIENIETTNSFRVNEDAIIRSSGGGSKEYDESASELISDGVLTASGRYRSFSHILILELALDEYCRTLIEISARENRERLLSILAPKADTPLFFQVSLIKAFATSAHPTAKAGALLTEAFKKNRALIIYFFEEPASVNTSWLEHLGEDILLQTVLAPKSVKEFETFLSYLLFRATNPDELIFRYLLKIAKAGSDWVNYKIIQALSSFPNPDDERVKDLAKTSAACIIESGFFEYVDKLNDIDPQKGSEFLKDVFNSQSVQAAERFYHSIEAPITKYLKQYPEEYFEPVVRLLENSLNNKHADKESIAKYKRGETTCISFGEETCEHEGKETITDLPELIQNILEANSKRIATEDPEVWRKVLPHTTENDYALPIYIALKAMLARPEEYKEEIYDLAVNEKYLACHSLEYITNVAVRGAYPYWTRRQKITWSRKVTTFAFHPEDEYYNNHEKLWRFAAVRPEHRIPSLARRISFLETIMGRPAPIEPTPLMQMGRSGRIVSPILFEELKEMPLDELMEESRLIMSGRLEKYDFLSSNIDEYGTELGKLVITDPVKYEPITNLIAYETRGEKIPKELKKELEEMVVFFLSEFEKENLLFTTKMAILRKFYDFPSSYVKRAVVRNLEKIIPECPEKLLPEIENTLLSYMEDPDPEDTPDDTVADRDPLTTGINSTRGTTFIGLSRLYRRKPGREVLKDALRKLNEDKHPAVRACAIYAIDIIIGVDKEFAKGLGIRFFDETDPRLKALFLHLVNMFYGSFPELKERIAKLLDEEADSEDKNTKESAFRLLLTGSFFDPTFEPLATPRLFGEKALPEFRELGALIFSQEILRREKDFEKYYAPLLKLAEPGEGEVIQECLRLLIHDKKDAEAQEIRPEEVLLPRIRKLLDTLIKHLGAFRGPRGCLFAFELFSYLDYCSTNTPYSNEVIELLNDLATSSDALTMLSPLSEQIGESLYKAALNTNIDRKHKATACDLLDKLARLGYTKGYEYWRELGCNDLE